MDQQKLHELRVFAAEIRLETLKIIGSRGFGHVGGSMSMADAMAVLYGAVMNIDPKNPRWEGRDWFVLSKGHGGPVMYATLGLKGYYPMESAYTLNQPGTDFPSHTDRNKTVGVDLTTGSLGQGMSEAIGAALGSRVRAAITMCSLPSATARRTRARSGRARSLPRTTSWTTSSAWWTTTSANWTARWRTSSATARASARSSTHSAGTSSMSRTAMTWSRSTTQSNRPMPARASRAA